MLFGHIGPSEMAVYSTVHRTSTFLFLGVQHVVMFSRRARGRRCFSLFRRTPCVLAVGQVVIARSLSLLGSGLRGTREFTSSEFPLTYSYWSDISTRPRSSSIQGRSTVVPHE